MSPDSAPPPMPQAPAAQAFLNRLEAALGPLPEPARRDIVAEIASHLAERTGHGALDAALAALGEPHDFARTFVEDHDLTNALNRAAPLPLLINILGRGARSALAFSTGALAVVLYAIAAAFVMVAVLKPITPRNVGLWRTDHGIDFGAIYGAAHSRPELIGYWIVPIGAIAGVICYLAATAVLKAAGRMLLRRPGGLAAA